MDLARKVALLQTCPLFDQLPTADLEQLAEKTALRHYRRDRWCSSKATRATACWVVADGRLKVLSRSENGDDLLLAVVAHRTASAPSPSPTAGRARPPSRPSRHRGPAGGPRRHHSPRGRRCPRSDAGRRRPAPHRHRSGPGLSRLGPATGETAARAVAGSPAATSSTCRGRRRHGGLHRGVPAKCQRGTARLPASRVDHRRWTRAARPRFRRAGALRRVLITGDAKRPPGGPDAGIGP